MTHKLVRDNIPKILKDLGQKPHVRLASAQELLQFLKVKLVEEAKEAEQAYSTKRVKEELADILEVIRAIADQYGLTWEKLEGKRLKKLERRGGFKKGYILEIT